MHHTNDPYEEESKYYHALEAACPQFPSTIISGEPYWGLQEIGNEQGAHLDEPEMNITRSISAARFKQSAKDGCRVVIQGIGGDEIFQIYHQDLDLLYNFPLLMWLKIIQNYIQKDGLALTLKMFTRSLKNAFMVKPIWSKLRGDFPDWVKPEWKQKMVSSDHPYHIEIPAVFANLTQKRRQVAFFSNGMCLAGLEYGYHTSMENLSEMRYPFLDRHLTEFSYRIPSEKIMNAQFALKPFLKSALSQILPKEIFNRNTKAVMRSSIQNGLQFMEKAKVNQLHLQAKQQQAKYVNFAVYDKKIKRLLQENTPMKRSLIAPIMMQAWVDNHGITL